MAERNRRWPVALVACAVLVLGASGAGVASAHEEFGTTDPVAARAGHPADLRTDRDTVDQDAVDAGRGESRGERFRTEEDADGSDGDPGPSRSVPNRPAQSRPAQPRADSAAAGARSASGATRSDPRTAPSPGEPSVLPASPADDPNAPIPLDPTIKLAPPDPPGSLVKGTPCTKDAVACVSLKQNKSWLFKKDPLTGETVIDHGPVPVRTGGPGKETPLGDFHVEWKNKNHKSGEYFVPSGCVKGAPGCEGAPMNWAVFFAEGGIAFHEGTLAIRSSGCVRLSAKEAEFYYTALQLGDKVEVRS